MADTSLDDFFAKKDKSKKKNKAKFIPVDILVKPGDEPKANKPAAEKKKKEKERDPADQSSVTTKKDPVARPILDEEEWVDFTEEAETDYSGLRVQNLQISSKEDDDQQDRENIQNEDEEDGENNDGRDVSSGPWRTDGQAPPQSQAPAPEPEPVKTEEAPAKPTGKYVPPGARSAAASGGSRSSMQARGKKKTAPNIQSEEDFPTLGGAPPAAPEWDRWDRSRYETVRSGGRQTDSSSNRNVQLSLGNRYESLQD